MVFRQVKNFTGERVPVWTQLHGTTRRRFGIALIALLLAWPASGQTSAPVVFASASVGVTLEPASEPRHGPNFQPGIGGNAPVWSLMVGAGVTQNIRLQGEVSLARFWSAPQRVRVGTIDYAETTASHKDVILSGVVSGRVGVSWVGAGVLFAKSETRWEGVANRAGVPPAPFAQSQERWKAGVVGALDVPISIGRHAAIVPMMRVYWFDHDEDGIGLSRHFVFRPAVAVEIHF